MSPPETERARLADEPEKPETKTQEGSRSQLGAVIQRLSADEKFLTDLVDAAPVENALLILAASRVRAAGEAIKKHLEPPSERSFWWNR